MSDTAQVILIGAGGHAKVLLDALTLSGIKVSGVSDPLQPTSGALARLHWYVDDDAILHLDVKTTRLVNAIGSTRDTTLRSRVYHKFKTAGFQFLQVIHPSACLSQQDMDIGKGLQALAGSVINASVSVGDNVLINTHAVVEHDCTIGSHTHVASGAVVCGGCLVGENVHVGAGAVIKQGVTVGSGSVVASGAVVIDNVQPYSLVAGVPARVKQLLHDT